jgi:PadR family transcriptional regulator PadR
VVPLCICVAVTSRAGEGTGPHRGHIFDGAAISSKCYSTRIIYTMKEPVRITRSFLDVVQAFVNAGRDELHGYKILKATGLGGPTVYKILERMTAMGWVTARWDDNPEDANKPRRRYYKLTSDGAQHARALIAEHRPRPRDTAFRPVLGEEHA